MTIHLSTGFEELDAVINGLNGGELVLIGGRPAMGKTTFALNIALNVAKGLKDKERSGVAFFSMEQSLSQLTGNFLSAITRIPSMKIIKGELTADEFQRISEASGDLEKMLIYIDDTPALSPAALRERCRKIKDDPEKGLRVVIIDYLQLLKSEKHSLMLQRLKKIATEFDVPVIVLSQLVRTIENRKNKRPRLSDIPACKDLSAVDKVLFLYRESYYLELNIPEQSENETDEEYRERFFEWNERLLSTENNYEIIIAKNPAGQCGTVNLRFNGKPT
ncbi:MAG: DnaB-like helicase C-terminal domain-containing protein [Alphaproteobacteria bacterium]|nr:DnaB-like helicase C-terminal domain-containing protein [Alphaproteobacteria bacterium]